MDIQETIDAPAAGMPDATPLPQPLTSPPTPRRGKRILSVVAALALWVAAGLLLWMCYFPVACGWLGWVGLVPLLFLVRSTARQAWVYFAAWVAGSAFFWAALSWMRVADERMYATWAMLAVYCSLYFPVAIWLMRFLDRRTRLPLVLTVPVVWTALEFLRAHLMTGFAWYFLAHTQHDFLAVIQIADLGGAYGVSFLVAAVNALIFEWLYRSGRLRRWFALREPAVPLRRRRLALQTLGVFGLLLATLAYGVWRLGQHDFATGPRVALVQSNLDQRLRNNAAAGNNAANQMIRHNGQLTDRAARMQPDLIVWPETSLPDDWIEVSPEIPANEVPVAWRNQQTETLDLARLIAHRWHSNIIVGMNAEVLGADGNRSRYNSAILVQKNGTPGGRYSKMHRVPFGEFIPLRESLPFMNRFSPYDFDYSIRPGEDFVRFPLNDYHFGVIICYEDTDPDLAREYVRPGEPPTDFLVNISNDGWFNGSAEHEEHLAICRFRAVECRRAIARAVNMGISGVIDGNGRVIRPPNRYGIPPLSGGPRYSPLRQEMMAYFPSLIPTNDRGPDVPVREWPEYKQIAEVFHDVIPLDTRESLYARYGDWLPWGCWTMLGLGLVWGFFRRPAS